MINKILIGIFKIIVKLINVLLAPINLLIVQFLPNFNNVLSYISNFFNLAVRYFGFVVDSFCIDSNVISFLILYWTFKLTFPLAVYTIKMVVKWYDKLKV